MKTKQVITGLLISILTTLAVLAGYRRFVYSSHMHRPASPSNTMPVVYTGFTGADFPGVESAPAPFAAAATTAVNATVHITTRINQTVNNHPDDSYPLPPFGSPSFPQTGSGSGAIISEDGYIVTNNHVIDGASRITVTLSNGRSVPAKVIGANAAADLAVLQIQGSRLPFLMYGNSDEVKIGQWVMAVGYPLNLQSTVTAGIVSAKGKHLELSVRHYNGVKMESYIQTDAVVNHGNSGGPLVNTAGRLIGINAYLASATGAYTGYSFTIPVNVVKRVVNDILRKPPTF